jgi:hypothetical protein
VLQTPSKSRDAASAGHTTGEEGSIVPRFILAIDPGDAKSAFVHYNPQSKEPIMAYGILPNEELLGLLTSEDWSDTKLVIEMVASFGMPVGREVFETVFWTGRFWEAFGGLRQRLYRKQVVVNICRSAAAKDANVRAALIDRFGGKNQAVGLKASQGPLYGISKDVWSALAIAVTAADMEGSHAWAA